MSVEFSVQRRRRGAKDGAHKVAGVYTGRLHSQIELIYVISGSGEIAVEGQTHTLMPGEAALCWPNRVHSYAALPCGSLYYMGIFDPAQLGRVGRGVQPG